MTSPTTPSRDWVRTRTEWAKIRGTCAACGHSGWCTQSSDGSVIKCMRAASDRPVKQKDGTTAWLHLTASMNCGTLAPARAEKERPRLKPAELTAMLKQYATALSPERRKRLSEQLGVSEMALKAFGVGYAVEYGAYSFPMVDGNRKPIGIHLRRAVPVPGRKHKFSVVGSQNGLFVPDDYEGFEVPASVSDDPCPLLLLMPEGVSDAMAARDMGFRSIGRPSNCAGAKLLRQLLSQSPKQEVVVVADRDETKYLPDGTPFWPGIEGALEVCEQLLDVCGRMQFMLPPPGVKDVREWLNKGGAAVGQSVTKFVEGRPWIVAARKRIEKRKREERRAPAA